MATFNQDSTVTCRKIHYPHIQVFLMAAALITFAAFLYKPLKEFRSEDKGPTILAATGKQITSLTAAHKTIETHLNIYDAPHFNLDKNTFSFRGYIIFTYDPKAVSFEVVDSFDIQKGTVTKNKPTIKKNADGTESAHYIIDVKFSLDMNYTDYPLDDHKLTFVLINPQASPDEVLYVAPENNFFIEKNHAMARWKDVGHTVQTGFLKKAHPHGEITYPALLFSIDYAHNAIRQTSIILLPMFIIFFLTTFALSLNPTRFHGTILTISTTGISALMAYRYVIENLAPKVGYFMLSDYLFFLFFFLVFLNFLLSMFIEEIPQKYLKWIIIGQYLLLLVSCGYFLLIWL